MFKTMITKTLPILFCSIFASPIIIAEEALNNLIWIGFNQNTYDYFNDGNSKFTPQTKSYGFSHQMAKNWSAAISYSKIKKQDRWQNKEVLDRDVFNSVEVNLKSKDFNLSWMPDDYGFTLSYSEIENLDKSFEQTPPVFTRKNVDDKGINFNYFDSIFHEQLSFSWSLGIQYLESKITSNHITGLENTNQVNSKMDQTNWGGNIDLSLTYWLENSHFNWAPQLNLSWNIELSSEEKLSGVVINGERKPVRQFNNRLSNNLTEPDSGNWELGIIFDWSPQWQSGIIYGQSISAEIDVKNIYFDLSYAF